MQSDGRLTVYYDGECQLCSREIDHYRKRDVAHRLNLVDISDPEFRAEAHGLDRRAVVRELHARLPSGELRIGVDAFVAIWNELPGFGWLADLSNVFGIRHAMRAGYKVFARVRPYLPKRQRSCESGACAT